MPNTEEKSKSKTQQIKEYYLANQSESYDSIAERFKTTRPTVYNIVSALRKEGKLPKLPENYRQKQPTPHAALEQECETVGLPIDDVSYYWYKGQHFSIASKPNQKSFAEISKEIIESIKSLSPSYPNIYYPEIKDGHLLVIDPADIHIGKLAKAFETGDEYNHQIAIERVKSGVAGILQKAKGYNIDKILFVVGNDILNIDNPKNTTTSGTHQDTNMMWWDAFIVAKKLIKECIEMLLTVAPVHVQYDPSNHDYQSGFMLAQVLEAYFSNCKGITFNVSIAHRKYFVYGKNIVGTTHGDGAKKTDLGFLMAHECDKWNECKHRYFYVHHIHHKESKDYMSVCVEALRSPSGTDSWHHRNGYQHSPKAVEGFIHHPEYGQVARLTHLF